MDRRYAGRATGVGHCRVLGRIPARHVYFLLGDDEKVSCRSNGGESTESSVQMDGPALTVLEGTVTKGVDMLLGLDVLQDWDAEIRMGTSKSITVRKREGRSKHGSSVVIPFVNQHGKHSSASRTKERHHGHDESMHSHQSRARHTSHSGLSTKSTARPSSHHGHQSHGNSKFHRHHHETSSYEDDNEYFSSTASDIESDLDLLEKTNHDDDLEEDMDSEILPRDFDNECLNGQDNLEEDEENDDYLEDVGEDTNEDHFDMSGL